MQVTRWMRYGHDRLYVKTEQGEPVGWVDLKTGMSEMQRPDLSGAFQAAVAASDLPVPVHTAAPAVAAPEAVVEPEVGQQEPYAVAVNSLMHDLANNRPGQGVRAEAETRLADMRSRSKVRTFLARALDAKTEERAFRVGADGEEAVGARLERLTKRGWHVLHSIPVGNRGSDIDHLLIGPGGVYTINTKNHPGGRVWVGEYAIRVNGQPTKYLAKSRYEAERVHKVLREHLSEEVPVRAVLVFLTGTVVPQVTVKQMPADVLVLDRMDIPGILKRAPQRLDTEAVRHIYGVSRRGNIWTD